MTLLQLQYFQVLAKVLHYTNASKQLHISQPTLSYAINELEKELGVALFEKKNKKIVLSPYGIVFLEYVNQALDTLDKSLEHLHAMQSGESGEVSIGYIYSISTSLIPQIVDKFKQLKENEHINFNFVQSVHSDLVEKLKNGDLDLIISSGPEDGLVSVPLAEQELYLIVANSHPLAKLKTVNFKDIAHEPFVLLDKTTSLRTILDKEFAKINVKPNILHEAHEWSAAAQYVAHSNTVTISPYTPGANILPITQINIVNPSLKREIYLSWSGTKSQMPPVRKVRNFILQTFDAKIKEPGL